MNGHIYHQMMLTCAGNTALRGGDISGFWPNADVFRWDKSYEFRTAPQAGQAPDDFPLVAADPMQWLDSLKAYAVGLRLHHIGRVRGPDQQLETPDRMLAGMVGGGQRWLVEVVGKESCELWEGFQRVGDKDDPNRKIWLWTQIRVGVVARKDMEEDPTLALDQAIPRLQAALVAIETNARQEKYENFAQIFREAHTALSSNGRGAREDWPDSRYIGFDACQLSILSALGHADVFGGMGSWNDLGGGAAYDAVSEALYAALNDGATALANSTFTP